MLIRITTLFLLLSTFAFGRANRCLIKVDGKFGYIDSLGNVLIKPQFDWAIQFSEGFAAVRINGKCGYIDTSGNFAIQPKYLYGDGFKGGFARVWIKTSGGVKFGMINKKGKEVLKLKYNYVEYQNEGFVGVAKTEKLGFYDLEKEKFITDFIYDKNEVWSFNEGLAMVKVGKNYGFINTHGDIAIEPIYKQVRMMQFSCGLASVCDWKTNKWGYIDTKGNLVVEYQFNEAYEFRDNIAFVNESYGKPGHFINKKGEKLFETEFTEAWGFNEGLCGVKVDNKYGVIDSLGNWIVQPIYDWLHVYFYNGWICFFNKIDDQARWGVLNSKGKEIIPPIYSRTLLNDGDCPLIEVYQGDCSNDINDCALGYVNLQGKVIWTPTQ
jgi:hypothetical protein